MFHSMLPLNLSEFNPYFTVFVFGSWTKGAVLINFKSLPSSPLLNHALSLQSGVAFKLILSAELLGRKVGAPS